MEKVKNKIKIIDERTIEDKIYIIRGQRVMIDVDLAEIYGYTTKAFNQQVQRNIEKFDEDFMFRLTNEEINIISRSQNVTLKSGRGHNIKYNPYVFTEQGIYMLMTVLKGELATKQSKALIRLFKQMKDYIIENNNYVTTTEFIKLSNQVNKNTIDIKENTKAIKRIEKNMATKKDLARIMDNFIIPERYKEFLILNGKKVESDIAYKNIYKLANKTIYIIDNYLGLKTLVLLKDIPKNIKVIIFSDNINKGLHKQELNDFQKEYPNVNISFIRTNGIYHDRYIILDYNEKTESIYLCGTSSKDSGNKITTIVELYDKNNYHIMINNLLNNKKLMI